MSNLQDNPFQTPRADLQASAGTSSAQPLYSLNGIGIATLFGTPLAGAYLLTQNLRKLGLDERVRQVWLTTVGIIAFTWLLVWLLPLKAPGAPLTAGLTVGMFQYAKLTHGVALQRHKDSGGHFLSNWRALGVGLLFMLAVIAAIFACVFALGMLA